jgi:Zn-dependent peptidase ImmA (M78 family)
MNERLEWRLDDLRNKYHTLDPFHIIEMCNIDLKYVPFVGGTLGLYRKVLGDPTIFLSDKLIDSPERYFVASHELCHALEHENIAGFYTLNERSRSKLENEANAFATSLCYSLYVEEHGDHSFTIEDLQREYGVPTSLSEIFL